MAESNMIYVVYPYAEGRYNAVKVNKKVGAISIHKAIANFENDESRSNRRWKTPIEAGSFNIAKIAQADSAADAVQKAKEQGLKYEPKPDVLSRYRSELKSASQAFENIGRQGQTQSQGPKVYGGTGIDPKIREALDGIFDTLMKNGPKR